MRSSLALIFIILLSSSSMILAGSGKRHHKHGKKHLRRLTARRLAAHDVNELIGSSHTDKKCVTVKDMANLRRTCPLSCTKTDGCRINHDWASAPDAFHLSIEGSKLCAT